MFKIICFKLLDKEIQQRMTSCTQNSKKWLILFWVEKILG